MAGRGRRGPGKLGESEGRRPEGWPRARRPKKLGETRKGEMKSERYFWKENRLEKDKNNERSR